MLRGGARHEGASFSPEEIVSDAVDLHTSWKKMAEVATQPSQEATTELQRIHQSSARGETGGVSDPAMKGPSEQEAAPPQQSSQHRASGVSQSVLDAQLEALALGEEVDSHNVLKLDPEGF